MKMLCDTRIHTHTCTSFYNLSDFYEFTLNGPLNCKVTQFTSDAQKLKISIDKNASQRVANTADGAVGRSS